MRSHYHSRRERKGAEKNVNLFSKGKKKTFEGHYEIMRAFYTCPVTYQLIIKLFLVVMYV